MPLPRHSRRPAPLWDPCGCGQRSKTNARTRKGPKRTVANKKK